jgi:UDP-N-acetylmuramate dehydrogenase
MDCFEKFSHLSADQVRVRQNVNLADYVAYKTGGPADVFIEIQTEAVIQEICKICYESKLPFFVLGSGTNLLVRDGGIRGVVLYLGAGLPGEYSVVSEDSENILLRVPAHWPKSRLLALALKNNWAGLEFSAGIPGTLGGAVWMNAGTKWGSYSDVVERVNFFHPEKGFYSKSREEIGFKYRGHGEGLMSLHTIIVSIDLRLSKNKSHDQISQMIDEILSYRGSKQPLERPNCGSVFKNPINSDKGAGRLIEAAGLKGSRVGMAQVSNKHANFILNLGGAKSNDIESLIDQCQRKVFEKFSIQLEREVIILGEP